MKSPVGFTVIVMVAVPVRFAATLLVAVTVKVSGTAALSGGSVGAMNDWTEPSAAPGVRTTPAGATQVKVRVPPAGSTPVAVRVPDAPLRIEIVGFEVIATTGGAPAGGGTTGTDTVTGVENGTTPPSPTCSENVRLCATVTSGATNVGVPDVVLLS